MKHPDSKAFILLTKVTLVSIFLIVVAGGVVRMTGSGMGCPDWPKCFEQYVPPTDVNQLPEDYKEIYSGKRAKKIQRFADLLESWGMDETAEQLRNDRSLLVEQDFNAFNTWTEYINRLIGAVSGVLVFLCLIASLIYFKRRPWLPVLCLIQVILMAFQAWMGAMTVATNLTPWVLTVHMLLAIVIIGLQIKIVRLAAKHSSRSVVVDGFQFKALIYVGIAVSAIQILAGTGVRQIVDGLEHRFPREQWIDELGGNLYFHRSFAIAVVLVNGAIFFLNVKRNIRLNEANWLMAVVVAEALAGIGLTYLDMPAALQPVHLVLAILMITFQLQLVQKVKTAKV